MKAAILNQSTYELYIKEVSRPVLTGSEVLIKLKAVSLNHHELWSIQDKSLKSSTDIILGSDGSGIVSELGPSANNWMIGDEVVINPSLNWGNNSNVQSSNFEILGFPKQGTFAEYISLDEKYIHKKPTHLSFEESASIPLAGLTAYRSLFTRGEYTDKSKILITGIGGGAAMFALNFSIAMGAEVFVTSGDDKKIKRALELGAIGGVNYKNENWSSMLLEKAGGFDIIIDSAAGRGFADLTDIANPGARIVLFGRTAGNISSLNPKTIFWKQLSIHGSTMGSNEEFEKMLRFVSSKQIKPIIDSIYPFENIEAGFEKMKKGRQFGKIIIKSGN